MKETRPKLDILPTKLDKIVEILTIVGLILLWILTITLYQNAPEIVPTHFDFKGNVTSTSSKNLMFILPVIATIVVILMRQLNKIPHEFNYLVRITPENAARQYAIGQRMLRVLQLSLVVMFSVATIWTAYPQVLNEMLGGFWFLMVLLLIIFIPLGFFLRQSLKNA